MSLVTCNGFLSPTLGGKLQGKLHCLTLVEGTTRSEQCPLHFCTNVITEVKGTAYAGKRKYNRMEPGV